MIVKLGCEWPLDVVLPTVAYIPTSINEYKNQPVDYRTLWAEALNATIAANPSCMIDYAYYPNSDDYFLTIYSGNCTCSQIDAVVFNSSVASQMCTSSGYGSVVKPHQILPYSFDYNNGNALLPVYPGSSKWVTSVHLGY